MTASHSAGSMLSIFVCGNDAGVGAEDVDAAKGGSRGSRHRLAGFPITDVGREAARAVAQFAGAGLGLRDPARNDHDPGTLPREYARDALADAFTGAGDDDRATTDGCEHDS